MGTFVLGPVGTYLKRIYHVSANSIQFLMKSMLFHFKLNLLKITKK